MKLYKITLDFEYDEDWDSIKAAAKKFAFDCEEKKDSDLLQVVVPVGKALNELGQIETEIFDNFMDEVLNPHHQVW